jgi:hypothetical protein
MSLIHGKAINSPFLFLNNRIFVYRNHGRGCDDVVKHDNPTTFLEELANYLNDYKNLHNLFNVEDCE